MESNPQNPREQVPRVLHSTFSRAPFTHCVDCGTEILDAETPYAVEKVVRQGEVVFEYAICASCTMNILREYSQESLESLREYLQSEGPLQETSLMDQVLEMLWQKENEDPEVLPPEPEVNACQRCGEGGEAFEEEHTVMGMLVGSRLMLGVNTICGACTEGMEDLLSQKTREVQEDFIQRTFPGVPADLHLPVGSISL